jgi:Flp pilus assembly protein TadG
MTFATRPNTWNNRVGRIPREDGAAAVEFALVLPILLLLVFGIFSFGQFYSQYEVLQGAAREGARAAAVRSDPSDVKDRVYEAADPYTPTKPPAVSVSSGGGACTDQTVGDQVTVKWDQKFDISLPFVPAVDTDVLIKGVFRCE